MRMPRINWMKVAEHFAASDPYAALLMADGSIQTRQGETIVDAPTTDTGDRQARYEQWCRRSARAIQPAAAAH